MKIDKTSGVYKACMLGILCAVCGILLSTVNAITAPIIQENALASVKSSLEQIYPGATFTDVTEDKIGLLELKDGEDTLIDGIYNAEGKGTIFTLHSTGYNADGFKFMIAYNNDGSVAGYSVLEQAETAGKGDKAFKDPYVSDVLKLTSSDTMPLISGATITTTAVGKAVDQARQVFNKMNNISYDENATATPAPKAEPVALGKEDFKDNKAECSETSNDGTTAVYACKAHGFEGVNEATVTIDVASKSVKSIEVTKFGDTESVGDQATKAAELEKYKGVTLESKVDSTTGATFTSTSLRAMITTALQAATK